MNAERRSRAAVAILSRLSDREVEVFARIARGMTRAEIALDLQLSRATITTYRSRVLDKLALASNFELVILAHRLGLAKRPRA